MADAATALAHRLIVVTRNLSDFEGLDVPVVNPWTHSGESAHEQLHEPRAVYASGKTPIRLWREQRGLSRAQLASEAGISVSFLTQIESGARKASPETLRRLAVALGVGVRPETSAESVKTRSPAPAPPSSP